MLLLQIKEGDRRYFCLLFFLLHCFVFLVLISLIFHHLYRSTHPMSHCYSLPVIDYFLSKARCNLLLPMAKQNLYSKFYWVKIRKSEIPYMKGWESKDIIDDYFIDYFIGIGVKMWCIHIFVHCQGQSCNSSPFRWGTVYHLPLCP